METPCKQPGEVTKSSSTVLNKKPKQDCSKYGLTWFMFDSFCVYNSIAVLWITQGKTTRMFLKRVILICATSDTQNSKFFQQNSSIGEWTFMLQCLNCQDSAAAKIWIEVYVWNAEFQSIVLHNKCVFEIINCPLLSCFWALMAYYWTIGTDDDVLFFELANLLTRLSFIFTNSLSFIVWYLKGGVHTYSHNTNPATIFSPCYLKN